MASTTRGSSSFANFLTILKMAPGIFSTVVAVENAVTAPKSGPSKMDLVLATVAIAADATPAIVDTMEKKDVATATALIAGAAVTTMNFLGQFKHVAAE